MPVSRLHLSLWSGLVEHSFAGLASFPLDSPGHGVVAELSVATRPQWVKCLQTWVRHSGVGPIDGILTIRAFA